jgi:hypothetical protein
LVLLFEVAVVVVLAHAVAVWHQIIDQVLVAYF